MTSMIRRAVSTWILAGLAGVGMGALADEGPKTPDQERATFVVDAGLSVDGVASEPLVRSPAALAWDEHGVLHVAENPGYPVGPGPGKAPEGAIVRLLDRNGDGRMEERVVVADGFGFPNGLMPWRGGWLVTDAPNLWWLADTNSDGRADIREVWFTGFFDQPDDAVARVLSHAGCGRLDLCGAGFEQRDGDVAEVAPPAGGGPEGR
jgi:hypothetical protein